MTKTNEKFNYTYSAPTEKERKEILDIRKDYLPNNETSEDIKKLRNLDKIVKKTPVAISISIGTIGCLIFGGGLTLILEKGEIIWGSVLGVIGIAVMAINCKLHEVVSKFFKRKYGEEILSLSNKILKEDN